MVIFMARGCSARYIQSYVPVRHGTVLHVMALSQAVRWRHCSCFGRAAEVLAPASEWAPDLHMQLWAGGANRCARGCGLRLLDDTYTQYTRESLVTAIPSTYQIKTTWT